MVDLPQTLKLPPLQLIMMEQRERKNGVCIAQHSKHSMTLVHPYIHTFNLHLAIESFLTFLDSSSSNFLNSSSSCLRVASGKDVRHLLLFPVLILNDIAISIVVVVKFVNYVK